MPHPDNHSSKKFDIAIKESSDTKAIENVHINL